ncbi:MAG TPA: AMP-binding protein [Alphaproteobacteria bacterium]
MAGAAAGTIAAAAPAALNSLAEILAELPPRLVDLARRGAVRWPNQIAMSEPSGASVTYGAFATAVEAASARLRALGIRAGDRVMIVNENCIAAGVVFFAASALDAWPTLVNARLSAREIDTIAGHAEPRRVFFTVGLSAEARTHAERFGATPCDLPGAASGALAVSSARDAKPELVTGDPVRDVTALIYTSGTTGMPKGVMLSHRACLYVASSPGAQRRPTPEDLVYCTLPIAHIFGLTSTWLRGLYGGAHVMLTPRFSAEHLADALERGITIFQGVPQMYAKLLEYARASGRKLKAPALRMATVGGAPIEPELKEAVEQALGMRLVNGWGMTEFASTVSRSLPQHVGRDISVGPVLPGIEVRIVDERGRDVPKGQAGEIWLRGPNCMLGYYKNEAATRDVLTPDGWYKTGDLGAVAADGALSIVDRIRDLIIVSGFNVYPAEVEAELTAHPAVTLAAIIGRRRAGNEEVIAFVQPALGARVSEAELAQFLKPRLAPYKQPARIVVLEQLPAAPTGKILKARLKAMAEAL